MSKLPTLRIALDIDDVLADFIPAINRKWEMLEPHDHWDSNGPSGQALIDHKDLMLDPDFWYNLNPITLASEVAQISDFVYCYITSSPRDVVNVRRKWLAENGFPVRPVISSADKALTMARLGCNVLIDDSPLNVNKALAAGHNAFLFQPWYNDVDHTGTPLSPHVIKSLTDAKVFSLIDTFKQEVNDILMKQQQKESRLQQGSNLIKKL